jgi:hypothetical protein
MGKKWNRDSRYNKYRHNLWLDEFYTTYFYWYRFLQVADADKTRQVDWTKYKGWGDSKIISTTLFDEWWKEPHSKRKSVYDGKSHPVERWEILFGYSKPQKDGKVLRKWNTEPKFSTTTNSKRDDLRFPLMVYERLHKHYEHYRIPPDKQRQILEMRTNGDGLLRIHSKIDLSYPAIKKYLKDNAYGDKYKITDWKTIGKEIKEIERRRVQRNKDRGITIKTPKTIDLTRYRRNADKILDAVCEGYFPYFPIDENLTEAERRKEQKNRRSLPSGKKHIHRWVRVPPEPNSVFPYLKPKPKPELIDPFLKAKRKAEKKEEQEIIVWLEQKKKKNPKITREERCKQIHEERKEAQKKDQLERQRIKDEIEFNEMMGYNIEKWEIA